MIGATIVRYILLTTMFVAGLQIGLELIASGQNNEEFRLMTAVQHFGQILVVFLAFDTWKMALNWLMPLAIDPKVTIASTTKQPTKAPPTPKEHGRPDGGWWYPDEIILTPHGPRYHLDEHCRYVGEAFSSKYLCKSFAMRLNSKPKEQ